MIEGGDQILASLNQTTRDNAALQIAMTQANALMGSTNSAEQVKRSASDGSFASLKGVGSSLKETARTN